MKHPIILATALGAALVAGPAAADAPQDKGQAKLDKVLAGRVAGEPESCIRILPNDRMTVIDKTAIVFGSGRTIYVNRTRDPDSLDDSDALVMRRMGSQLCRTDIVTSFDRFGGFYTGNVMLGDFVPYRRADS